MPNFFYVTIYYTDGRTENYKGQLYYLGGQEHEDMKLYRELKQKIETGKKDGSIEYAHWDFDS